MMHHLVPCALLLLWWWCDVACAIRCYSCANEFIQWRHFFLKRNYGLTSSDKECGLLDYDSDQYQSCQSTCFIFHLNATDKQTGYTKTLGVGRGCSRAFLTDAQHLHLGLGAHSKHSSIGAYLPTEFDKYDIYEHWCFCAADKCNKDSCFAFSPASPYNNYDYISQYFARRTTYGNAYSPWNSATTPSVLLGMLASTAAVSRV